MNEGLWSGGGQAAPSLARPLLKLFCITVPPSSTRRREGRTRSRVQVALVLIAFKPWGHRLNVPILTGKQYLAMANALKHFPKNLSLTFFGKFVQLLFPL